jgi:hypothetical protein
MDEANLEPEASGAGSAAEAARVEAEAATAAAAAAQEQLFWMDAPLLLAELVWGLLRCAAVLPAAALATAPQAQQSHQDLLGRVQALLEGPHGLFEAVLGVQCLAVPQTTRVGIDEGEMIDQQQQDAAVQEEQQPVEQQDQDADAYVNQQHEVADGEDGGAAAADAAAALSE